MDKPKVLGTLEENHTFCRECGRAIPLKEEYCEEHRPIKCEHETTKIPKIKRSRIEEREYWILEDIDKGIWRKEVRKVKIITMLTPDYLLMYCGICGSYINRYTEKEEIIG